MAESTQAERRWLALQRDWRRDREDLLRDHPDLFDRKILRQFSETSVRRLDEGGGLAAAVWSEMCEHVHMSSEHRHRLARLFFADVDQSDFVAMCVVEDDESALVRVSEGLQSLLMFLSGLQTYLLFGRRTAFQTIRLTTSIIAIETGVPLQRVGFTDLLIRDYLIENKLFGGRGKAHPDLNPRAEDLATAVMSAAYQFVLAHEAGHFLLDHPTPGRTSMGTEKVPVVAERAQLEYDADMFALEFVQQIYARLGTSEPYSTALGAAGVALLAVYIFEQGTLLRPARTHPPATDRWTALTARAERAEGWPPSIDYLYQAIVSATSASGAYTAADWAQLPSAGGRRWGREIRERLEMLPTFDHLLNAPLEALTLDDVAAEYEGIATAARAQTSSDTIDDALTKMGVDPKVAARVADPETALSFNRLLSVIRKSEAFQSLPGPELSLAAGAVLTRRLGALVEPRPSTHSAN